MRFLVLPIPVDPAVPEATTEPLSTMMPPAMPIYVEAVISLLFVAAVVVICLLIMSWFSKKD